MEKITCPACGKKFDSNESMAQHRQAVHGNEQKKPALSGKQLLIAGVALVAIVVLYVLVSSPAYVPLTADGDHVRGAQNASVLVVEYSDFQCPFCVRFAKETEPSITKEYIDSGTVKFVYRHMPLPIHEYSEKAAEASECADDQGKFWEYHDLLFASNVLTTPALKQYASQLGMDRARFDKCLDSSAMAGRVSNDKAAGAAQGVQGTPTFFINDRRVDGAQPFSAFKNVIDRELAK